MVIFHSYVKLPEGTLKNWCCTTRNGRSYRPVHLLDIPGPLEPNCRTTCTSLPTPRSMSKPSVFNTILLADLSFSKKSGEFSMFNPTFSKTYPLSRHLIHSDLRSNWTKNSNYGMRIVPQGRLHFQATLVFNRAKPPPIRTYFLCKIKHFIHSIPFKTPTTIWNKSDNLKAKNKRRGKNNTYQKSTNMWFTYVYIGFFTYFWKNMVF